MSAFKKVTVNLPTEQVKFLQDLATKEKVSVSTPATGDQFGESSLLTTRARSEDPHRDGTRIREVIRK